MCVSVCLCVCVYCVYVCVYVCMCMSVCICVCVCVCILAMWLCVHYSDSCSEKQGWKSLLCSIGMWIRCYVEKHQALQRAPAMVPLLPLLLSMILSVIWHEVPGRGCLGAMAFLRQNSLSPSPLYSEREKAWTQEDSSSVFFSRQMS